MIQEYELCFLCCLERIGCEEVIEQNVMGCEI